MWTGASVRAPTMLSVVARRWCRRVGRQARCGSTPGPTLLHALSAVVPVNVASIGEHFNCTPAPAPQDLDSVALPTSHCVPAGATQHGRCEGVAVARRCRPRAPSFVQGRARTLTRLHGGVHCTPRRGTQATVIHATQPRGRATAAAWLPTSPRNHPMCCHSHKYFQGNLTAAAQMQNQHGP